MSDFKRFIYRIGPIETPNDILTAYFVYPGNEGAESFLARDDDTALLDIVSVYPASTLQCESELAESARKFGIEPGDITPVRAHMIGVVAFDMALGEQLSNIVHDGLFYQYGKAASVYWNSAPWEFNYTQRPVLISFQGSVDAVLECMVLGASGKEFGLVMYSDQGAVERAVQLHDAGSVDEAARLDSLGIAFVSEPKFALSAMKRAYGLERFPIPLKVFQGEKRALSDLDLLALSAALQALSALQDDMELSFATVSVQDLETTVVARPA